MLIAGWLTPVNENTGNHGKDKDKEDLWGGECTVANLVVTVTVPRSPPVGPMDQSKGKPTKDNRFGKHEAFGPW